MRASIHTWAWIGWLLAALVALSTTRNPLYILLILLCIAIVSLTLRSREDTAAPFVSPLRFTLVVVSLSALFNAAISHFGETILFHLPGQIPLIGGPITLEALVYGTITGLVLTGIFGSFTVLNQALPVRKLIRLVPRAFFPVAVVTSIAITFIPNTTRQYKQIREAQALRGHRLRGVGDWLPMVIPLLVGGLERAMQLAEAMTSRGFASGEAPGSDTRQRSVMLAGLMILLSGWLLRLNNDLRIVGTVLMSLGVASVLGMLVFIGRSVPRTTYIREAWKGLDWLVSLGAVIVLATFLFPLPWVDKSTLHYQVYPLISLPGFDLRIGGAILGLLIPAITTRRSP